MKQIIFILIFIVLTFLGYCQIEIHGYFETGYNLEAIHKIDNEFRYPYNQTFYIDMQLYFILFNFFEIGGGIKSDFEYLKIDNYSPFLDTYAIFIRKNFKNFEIGFINICAHPVLPYGDNNENTYDEHKRKLYLKYIF